MTSVSPSNRVMSAIVPVHRIHQPEEERDLMSQVVVSVEGDLAAFSRAARLNLLGSGAARPA